MTTGVPISDAQRSNIIRCVVEGGMPLRVAAAEAGVSVSTAHKALRDAGYRPQTRTVWVR